LTLREKLPADRSTVIANEVAWKEDHRRLSNGALSYKKLALAMAHPVSRVWAGYWQRAANGNEG
jgi:hypothetical protein